MTQTGVVARLALRELWISFRLFAVVTAFTAAGAAVALVPVPLPDTMQRLGVGLGLATLVAGVVAAWSMAGERRTGRAGWLVSRSVPRGTLLAGWFVALGGVTLGGVTAAGLLGWLAATSVTLRLEPAGYAALLAAVGAGGLAVVAVGLLAGTFLPPAPAALCVAALGVAAGAAAWLLTSDASFVPGGAWVALAALREPGEAIGPGLRATGVGLAAAAAALVLGRLAVERAEL